MRTIHLTAWLSLALAFIATPAFAGNAEICDDLKSGASKGLYGLCIAYHNAGNARSQERILDSYEKKAGPNDPPMPGTELAEPCVCWTLDEMAAAWDPDSDNNTHEPAFHMIGGPLERAVYTHIEPVQFPVNIQFLVADGMCAYFSPSKSSSNIELDSEQEADCRAAVQALACEDWGNCPPSE